MFRATLLAAALVTVFTGAHAATAPLTAQEALTQMNAVSMTTITSRSSVHGRAWAGETVSGGNYGSQLGKAVASDYAGLTSQGAVSGAMVNNGGAVVVKGDVSGMTVNSGQSAVYGNVAGTNFNGAAYVSGATAGVNFNGGRKTALTDTMTKSVGAATSTDFDTVLTGLSDSLFALKSTGSSVSYSGNKATFTAVADANGVAVFDLTGIDDDLFKMGEFTFNLNGATTVIMNSDVTSANITANFLGGGAFKMSSVLWNFHDTTNLTIGSQFGGTVLATDAAFTNRADIEGSVFANSIDMYSQIHVQTFSGNVGLLSAVPEPGHIAMIMAGLAVIGVARTRRRDDGFKQG